VVDQRLFDDLPLGRGLRIKQRRLRGDIQRFPHVAGLERVVEARHLADLESNSAVIDRIKSRFSDLHQILARRQGYDAVVSGSVGNSLALRRRFGSRNGDGGAGHHGS
jgi:hypothetical protein